MKEIRIVEVKSEFGAGTRGASLGIDAIKLASTKKNSDLFSQYPIHTVDFTTSQVLYEGEENTNAKYIEEILNVETKVCNLVADVASQHFPIILGGDHSVGGGTLCGMKKAYSDKRIGVVWIDAHADLHTPYTTPSGNVHGMPLAMTLAIDNEKNAINQLSDSEKGLWEKMKNVGMEGAKIDAEDIVFIGLRDVETPEMAFINDNGIKVIKVEEVRERTAEVIVEEVLEKLKACDIICISFDVDSMDPDEVSWGTGTPVKGGLTKAEAITLNAGLVSSPKVASWEMVEVNPLLDSENAMGEAAFDVLEAVIKTKN